MAIASGRRLMTHSGHVILWAIQPLYSRTLLANLSTLLLLTACGYDGDGDYRESGIWPFRYYELVLPEMPFEQGSENNFYLQGYGSHGRSLLTVIIVAQDPVEFHRLHLPVSVTLTANGEEVFARDGSLNQHFLRMRSEGATSLPTEHEWHCRFVYADSKINSQAVPFDIKNDPIPTIELRCSHFAPTEQSKYRMRIAVPDSGASIGEAVVNVTLSSSWK